MTLKGSVFAKIVISCLFVWALAGCSSSEQTPVPTATAPASSAEMQVPSAPPPSAVPTLTALPMATQLPTPTVLREAYTLTILHTNDTGGEVFPCG